MSCPPGLTERAVRAAVGATSFDRGRDYLDRGRVLSTEVSADGVSGEVAGTGPGPYRVVVQLGTRRGSALVGTCTCPVTVNCKHVAAVSLSVLSGTDDDALAEWERQLAGVLPPAPGPASDRPLGVQFEVVDGDARTRGPDPSAPSLPRMRLRPVTIGRRGDWVRKGVSWRGLALDSFGGTDPHPALPLLRTFWRRLSVPDYGFADELFLDDAGLDVWPLLDDLVSAGVPLVFGRGGAVDLAGTPLTVSVDLTTQDGALRLSAAIDGGGGRGTEGVSDALPVGDPPVGLWSLTGRGAAARLRLWRFERPCDPVAADLLRRDGPLVVPAADTDLFRRRYLPRLRRVTAIGSSDSSVPLPPVPLPRLLLTATFGDGHLADIDWYVRYPTADGDRRFPLTTDSGDDGDDGVIGGGADPAAVDAADAAAIRDRIAERRLLDTLDTAGLELITVRGGGRHRRIPTRPLRLRGMQTAELANLVLPTLPDRGIDVEVYGTPLDYRPADGDPRIDVRLADTDDPDWFDLKVTIAVDGQPVPFAELFTALATEQPLLLPSGLYLQTDRPEFHRLRQLIEQARQLADPQSGELRLATVHAGLWDELTELGDARAQSARWRTAVQGLLDHEQLAPADPPPGLRADLRPYQLVGFRWLAQLSDAGLGGILADDMGLGKTLQALALVAHRARSGSAPALVVAPTSVVGNWVAEAGRFTPDLTVVTVGGVATRRGAELAELITGADLVVTSYSLLRREIDRYAALPWSALLLDEAQAVKNHTGKTHRCVRRLSIPVTVAITGTPLENNLMELWALLSVVAPGLFPDQQEFTDTYRRPIENGTDPRALETLRRRVRPLMLRRSKGLVAADLPPKQEQVLAVELGDEHRTLYSTELQRARQQVLGLLDDLQHNRFQILQTLTRLRQLALSPGLVDPENAGLGSAKIDALVEHLTEVAAEGHRALVFSQFTRFLRQAEGALTAAGLQTVYLDGGTKDRDATVARFREGTAPAFLISLKAGGFGLNLTEADYCFVLDPWWNPAAEAQAVDRAHRIGQQRPVMVYRLIATDTIEEKVLALQQSKRDLFDKVVSDGAAPSSSLSADDLRQLLD